MSSTTNTSIADTSISDPTTNASIADTTTTTTTAVNTSTDQTLTPAPTILPLLKVAQQITVPTSYAVNGVSKELVHGSFQSSDESVATVSSEGLVSRINGTDGTEVTITYTASFIEPGIGFYPVEFTVTYAVYQPDLNEVFVGTLETVEVAAA